MKRMALVRWALVSGVSFAAFAVACGGDDDAAVVKSPSSQGGSAGAGGSASGAAGGGAAGSASGAAGQGVAGETAAGAAGQAAGAAGESAAGAAGESAAGGAGETAAGAAGEAAAGAAGDGSGVAGAAGDGSAGAPGAGSSGAAGISAAGNAGAGGTMDGGGSGGTAGAGAAGAGGDGGTAGAGGAGTGIDLALAAACKKVAEADCEKQEECLAGLVTRTFGAAGDAACVAALSKECITAATAPGSKTQPADELACAAATQQASCLQWRSPGPLAKCIPVKGSKPLGSTCSFDNQCSTGNCVRAAGASCGTCSALPAANAICQPTTGCGPQPLVCAADNNFGAVTHCVAPGGAGTSCKDDSRCDAGFACEGNAITKSCVALTTAGGNCTGNNSQPCDIDAGLTCKPGTGIVTPGKCESAALANAGEGCGPQHKDALCTGGTSCVSGTCVADATALGQACHPTQGPFCRSPLDCLKAVGGTFTCQELTGDSCKLSNFVTKSDDASSRNREEASSFCLAERAEGSLSSSSNCIKCAGTTLSGVPRTVSVVIAWRRSAPVVDWNRRRPNAGRMAIKWSNKSDWMSSYADQAVVVVKQ
jgi:hypothetical protein